MVCSFAKFLALGLIAADGASATPLNEKTKTAYNDIAGKTAASWNTAWTTEEEVHKQTCLELDAIRNLLTTTSFTQEDFSGAEVTLDATTKEVKICTAAGSLSLQNKVLTLLKNDYGEYKFGTSLSENGATPAAKIASVHTSFMAQLRKRFDYVKAKTTSSESFGDDGNTSKDKRQKAKQSLYAVRLEEYNSIAGGAALSPTGLLTARILQLKSATEQKETEAAEAKKKAAKKKAEEEAAATVGGVFGVLAGLAIAFVGLLFSPCFQYDFKNHAFDWEKNYQKPDYYKELDGDARHWRNEVNEAFGLPEEQPPKEPAGKVDSAAASSSALTLVPVVVLAGGVFAVARRGLKRRAQKKAKRVSRAQQKLHEDL